MIEYEDALAEGYISEDALRFENPSFDNSIVAVDYDGRLRYDYDLMVEELMKQDDMGGEEAIDFISYNTLRIRWHSRSGSISRSGLRSYYNQI